MKLPGLRAWSDIVSRCLTDAHSSGDLAIEEVADAILTITAEVNEAEAFTLE